MAKLTLNQLIQALDRFPKLLVGTKVYRPLAEFARDMLYRRVKSGYGVNTDDQPAASTSRQKLKPLSKSYRDFRSGKAYFFRGPEGKIRRVPGRSTRLDNIGAFFSPSRSNLTMTGEMLESLRFTVTSDGFKLIIPNTRRSDGKTNAEVARYVAQNGRPFMAFHSGELLILRRQLTDIIRDRIKSTGL